MNFTEQGLQLIKTFENCVLVAYEDLGGTLTIGYGYTGSDVVPGLIWSQQQADFQLDESITYVRKLVDMMVKVAITDSQYSAIVCLAFNIGCGALHNSTLLKYVNSKLTNPNYIDDAADEFLRWDHINGEESPGLLRRRQAERSLFLS